MNEAEASQFITDTFKGVDVVVDTGSHFFFYNPDPTIPPDHMFPFVTIVTNDNNDPFSDLERPSIFRINVGVSKQTFSSLFDLQKFRDDEASGALASVYNYTALDTLMPHPVYGQMYWLCILSPSDKVFETTVRPLLDEAYGMAVSKYDRAGSRKQA